MSVGGSGVLFAVALAMGIVFLHLQQVNMLSGSIGEFWKRNDLRARQSKLFLLASLLSCLIALVYPLVATVVAVVFFVAHAILSMTEFR